MKNPIARAYHYLTDDMPFELEIVDVKEWRPTMEIDTSFCAIQPETPTPLVRHFINNWRARGGQNNNNKGKDN